MLEMWVTIIGIITIIILKIFLNVNFKKIKGLQDRELNELESLTTRFPKDEKICKDILKKLNNTSEVKIKSEPEYSSCLYTIFNNTIIIGKFKQEYMKIQTIAHECIHSCQSKRVLWSNFIISNIYLIYFATILILTYFNKLPYTNIHLIILIFLSFIQYIIRCFLEDDAMIKARFIAKEYIEENKILNKKDTEKLLEEYDTINNIAIPFNNYYLITMNIIKIIIYAFVCII